MNLLFCSFVSYWDVFIKQSGHFCTGLGWMYLVFIFFDHVEFLLFNLFFVPVMVICFLDVLFIHIFIVWIIEIIFLFVIVSQFPTWVYSSVILISMSLLIHFFFVISISLIIALTLSIHSRWAIISWFEGCSAGAFIFSGNVKMCKFKFPFQW